jgi:hypothetical protein
MIVAIASLRSFLTRRLLFPIPPDDNPPASCQMR